VLVFQAIDTDSLLHYSRANFRIAVIWPQSAHQVGRNLLPGADPYNLSQLRYNFGSAHAAFIT
jgi:hypothetical protein